MNELASWFGLKKHPFEKDIKTKDLFLSNAAKECSARLEWIKRTGGILLLTGDPGVGKTVAIRRFVDALNDNLFHPVYTPLTTLKRTDILRHISQKLGLPPRSTKSALFEQIQKEILESKEQRGRTVLLILDEAQLLQIGPLEEIRLLTNFKMDSLEPFILIFAGQSDLDRIMDYAIMEPLSQRLRLRYHMPALRPEETGPYIAHQLLLAGTKEPLFAQDAIAALHDVGFGLPRKIGTIALQAMLYAMFSNKRTVDADMVLKVKTGG